MTCKICNGNMRYQIPNHYHETMEWVDCMDQKQVLKNYH